MQQFILNNVNLTIAKILTQSLFILTFGSLEGLREFEFLGRFWEKKTSEIWFFSEGIYCKFLVVFWLFRNHLHKEISPTHLLLKP